MVRQPLSSRHVQGPQHRDAAVVLDADVGPPLERAHGLFAYPREAMLVIIMPWRLGQMARELIKISFGKIKGSAVLEAMQNEPGLSIRSHYPEDLTPSAWAWRDPNNIRDA